jgi:hypothetical protein
MDRPKIPELRNLTSFTYEEEESFVLDNRILKLEELEFTYKNSKLEEISSVNFGSRFGYYLKYNYFEFLKYRLRFSERFIDSPEIILDLRVINKVDLDGKQKYIRDLIEQLNDVKKSLDEKFNFVCKEKYKAFISI